VASALAVFGIALALMPIGLEAIGYQVSHRQGYAILGLTALLIAAGVVVFFWPWIRGAWLWLRRDAALRRAEAERDEARSTLKTLEQRLEEFRVKMAGDLDKQIERTRQLTNELRNGRLAEENQSLKEQLRQAEQQRDELMSGERRKRIEDWRSAISNHEFGGYPRFASTAAYSQMKPYLRPKVVEMLEAPRTFHVGNEARGDSAYQYTLLDEVARIEREWGLI
jgi:F0F1-type ATP synthase membrane subunit b/b'